VLANPANGAATETQLKDVGAAARAIGLQIQIHNANTSAEIDAAFETMSRERADAVFVAISTFFNGRRVQLAQLAAFHRLPASYGDRDYVEAGGLMSYGTSTVDGYRQVGIYTGRILNGAKPTDLPVVQSSKIELVINDRQDARPHGARQTTRGRRRRDRVGFLFAAPAHGRNWHCWEETRHRN